MSTRKEVNKQLAKQKENTERINVFLPPEILTRLKKIASEKGMTVSGLTRLIILEYLKR